MVIMHSEAYYEFVHRRDKDGYRQGYDNKLFNKINENERVEVEQLIIESFDKGDWEMSVFLPQLKLTNGIDKLKGTIKKLKPGCYAYCIIMHVLYNATLENEYIDNLASILYENQDEDVRMDAATHLLLCKISEKLYQIFKKGCLYDEDEDVRFQCVNGMFYCRGIVKNALGIHYFEEPWKQLRTKMYDDEDDKRKMAVDEFERMIEKYSLS